MKTSKEEQIEAIKLAIDADTGEPGYWHSFTPQERIWALELMNQRKYGYDDQSVPRIQRVIQVLTLEELRAETDPPRSQNPPTDRS